VLLGAATFAVAPAGCCFSEYKGGGGPPEFPPVVGGMLCMPFEGFVGSTRGPPTNIPVARGAWIFSGNLNFSVFAGCLCLYFFFDFLLSFCSRTVSRFCSVLTFVSSVSIFASISFIV